MIKYFHSNFEDAAQYMSIIVNMGLDQMTGAAN